MAYSVRKSVHAISMLLSVKPLLLRRNNIGAPYQAMGFVSYNIPQHTFLFFLFFLSSFLPFCFFLSLPHAVLTPDISQFQDGTDAITGECLLAYATVFLFMFVYLWTECSWTSNKLLQCFCTTGYTVC